jgi:autotransporter-associated beta strand protein
VNVTISGSNAALINSGTILQSGSGRAIEANGTGITITNTLGSLIETSGADAIQAGNINPATSIFLNNLGTIQSGAGQAVDWSDILTGSNSITNSGLIRAMATTKDAVRLGVNGTLINTGTIEAISVSGTTNSDGLQVDHSGAVITNSGIISGRHGITGGDEVNPYVLTITNNVGGLITAVNGSGVNIDGFPSSATVFNYGIIRGAYDGVSDSVDGDGVDVDGILHLTNSGTVAGTDAVGVDKGGDINNSEGIAAGGGTIINNVGAVISGQMTTGTSGVGNGILIDNGKGESGIAATTITNSGLIRGYTGFGIKITGSFNDTVTNETTGTIRGGQGAAIQTGGGDDLVTNRGSIIGDSGSAVALDDGDDTLVVEGGAASITGGIDGGTGTNTLTLRPGTGNTFSYAGVISNFSIVAVDGGTVILSGSSTYAGPTTVVSGTLLANNTAGSALGTGNVSVESGALLGGTGSISGTTTVQSGGTLTGGAANAIGTLTLGALDLAPGSIFHFDVNTTTGSYDLLNVDSLSLNGSTLFFNDLNSAPLSIGTIIPLINFDTFTRGFFAGLPEGATFFAGSNWFQISYGLTVVAVEVTVASVPEIDPNSLGSAAALVLGVLGMLERRRLKAA